MSYDGKITASAGKGKDAPTVTLNDPKYKANMTLADWVKHYGEKIVLSHFLASRAVTLQRVMRQALTSEGGTVEKAIAAGTAKANDLTAATRTGARKTKRHSREEVEAQFKAKGLNPKDPAIVAIIDGLFK